MVRTRSLSLVWDTMMAREVGNKTVIGQIVIENTLNHITIKNMIQKAWNLEGYSKLINLFLFTSLRILEESKPKQSKIKV